MSESDKTPSDNTPRPQPIELAVELVPEPDPIAQERVELERLLFSSNPRSSEYKKAAARIRELNDMYTSEPDSLNALSNRELVDLTEDGSTPVSIDEIEAILKARKQGKSLPKKRRK